VDVAGRTTPLAARMVVNHTKIQRLWREEGLRVAQRWPRKRNGSSAGDAPTAVAPKIVRAVDFHFDTDE